MRTRSAKTVRMMNVIHALLTSLPGKAAHIDEIMDDVALHQLVPGGMVPMNSVRSQLSRDSRFRTLGKNIWGLDE